MRYLLPGMILVALGCQSPAQRPGVVALPEDSGPQPFGDLVTRARQQAMTALEAYYVDRWPEVEEAARGLEQTARFLRRSSGVPSNRTWASPGPRRVSG